MRKKLRAWAYLFLVILGISGCTTDHPESSHSDRPVVYASFYPVYDLVDTVAGDTIDLRVFMPSDKDPHLWEPTPKNLKELAQADLLVVNGANFEPWLDQVQDALPHLDIIQLADYADLISYKGAATLGDFQYLARPGLTAGENYSIIFGHTHEKFMRVAFIDNQDGLEGKKLIEHAKAIMEDDGRDIAQGSHPTEVEDGEVLKIAMGHDSGRFDFTVPYDGDWIAVSDRVSEQLLPYDFVTSNGNLLEPQLLMEGSSVSVDKVTYDPHSWLSLNNAKRYVNAINDTFRERYPENALLYEENKFQLVSDLSQLQNEYTMKLRDIEDREFIVSHNAYEYLSRDFELIQYPLQGLTSLTDPSVRSLVDAIRFVKSSDIEYIYYEYGSLPYGADTIAEEVGGETLPLASMEFVRTDQKDMADGYVGFMRMNLENIYRSLGEGNEE